MNNDSELDLTSMTFESFEEVSSTPFFKASECSPGQTFTGTLVRSAEGGEYKNKIYFIETAEGQVGIWGTTDLDSKMSRVPIGKRVRVSYDGSTSGKNGKLVHRWKVAVAS